MYRNKKFILLVVIILVLAGTSLFLWKKKSSNHPPSSPQGLINKVDYSGPTKEEAKAGDQQKAENVQKDQQLSNTKPASTASVQITDATQYDNTIEVRAFVPNVFETGKCTAVFTKGGSPKVTTVSIAFKDASTTQCGANDTPRSSFSSTGDWQLTLTYTSDTGISGSANKTVTIR